MKPKFLMVYNAEKDAMSKVLDFAHKILRPSSYRCELCALTHGYFGEREKWTEFRKQSGLEIDFVYLPEFQRQFGLIGNAPPLALMNRGEGWVLVLDQKDFQAMKSVDDLILRISELSSDAKNSLEKE